MSSNNALQVKAANREWKVLVVDDDRTCLTSLEKMLRICSYKVTACQSGKEALSILKDDQNHFDLVIADACMRDMDGLKFVKHISEQTDLPVIVMSSDDNEDVIKEWFINGVCDYLVKPIRIENVRHVWMNVYRSQRYGLTKRVEQSWSSSETTIVINNEPNTLGYQKISDCEDTKSPKKRKVDDDDQVGDYVRVNEEYVTNYSRKKQRMIWTPELHQKFVAAFNQLGNLKAVPKKILEIMNVPGLTRENVASHLQKYRQYHKRLEQRKHEGSITTTKAQLVATTTLRTTSFHHTQTHEITGQMAHTEKFHAPANESMTTFGGIAAATDVNLAIIKHIDQGSNVIYHPFASYGAKPPWISYCTEDCHVKMEANCSTAIEMDSIRGLGQPCEYGSGQTRTYENLFDWSYIHDDAALYINQLDQSN